MKKELIIYIFMLIVVFTFNNVSYSINKNNQFQNSLYVNNINDKDIKIEIANVETINSAISLEEIYESYSIITMDITNNGLDNVELSNIDYFVYQDNKKLQTFIQSQNKYLGFVGTLSSGEQKEIKIGVVLEKKNTPLKLVFENLSDSKKEKIIKVINI
ncbi:hypothetical protein [Terrisporobacter mayombei]|uniref:DUF4352 domain-containing protein n=1 Tax=Terrisporobacter mayombei TaxID=1541 RepID=A0ABY9PVR4_9FIRM|nr:hypothetical protein [Terrisporobacter mayombei]MCC3869899.1 hypothetical protein [Terrisporobacter mayombei]WMT79790.1 hypothetical protein TEMA_00570 [Terrisporobacter mayombei]